MRKTLLVGLWVLAAAGMARASWAESKTTLASEALTVTFSEATGQVEGISDATGAAISVGCEDRYDLDGKTSSESHDEIISMKMEKKRVSFECVNKKLGIKISKEYRLDGRVLEKETRYLGGQEEKLLFKLASRTRLEPGLYKDGYYYTATDDGWKVSGIPFIPGSILKKPMPSTLSMGSFVYYFPKSDRVFTHYRYKVDGHYFYGFSSDADQNPVESQYIPGGAITAIGMAFISGQTGVTFESRYALLDGDPSDYHRYLMNQPPYTEYESHKTPTWFPKCRMFMTKYSYGGRWVDVGAELQGLMENRDGVLKDIADFMKLLKDDEYLMVFFNHWSVQGDYPYEGTFRYYDWRNRSGYSKPIPIEKLKENLRMVQAISPRIKIGGYVDFFPAAGTPPYDEHKDWMLYGRDGKLITSGDSSCPAGLADWSSGYREYCLNQMTHCLTDLGFAWVHVDFGLGENVNWKPRNVVQVYEMAKFYDEMMKIFEQHDAAIVQNVAPVVGLWAVGGYMECQQPGRWETRDWRITAVPGWLGLLYRTHRPGVWLNLCYGTRDMYGVRDAQTGMRGWIREGITWWRDVARSLAHELVIDEMLEMKASDVRVFPSWWKLQTDKLELDPMQKGETLVIPALWHGEKSSEEEISLNTADLKSKKGDCLFGFDLLLSSAAMLDPFKPVPWKVDYLQAIGFNVVQNPPARYAHRMKLEPLRNYYHVLTGVPGWVYTANGTRTSFLLPENAGVKITGSLPADASAYDLAVQDSGSAAQILAYVPANWKGVKAEINGREVQPALVAFLGSRLLLMDVAQGASDIRISDAGTPNLDSLPKADYANPSTDFWFATSQRLWYTNLDHRAYPEEGKSCLALKVLAPAADGFVEFPSDEPEPASGFSLSMKGQNSGGRAVVVLNAGEDWSCEIKDDFTGWKEFNVTKDQMTPSTAAKKWDITHLMTLRVFPAGGQEMHFADIRLLPAREGDIPKAAPEGKRRLTVSRAKTPPAMDGQGNSPCWKNCDVATDFFHYGLGTKLADAKTSVKACYDDDNLYLFFNNIEPIVKLPDRKTATKGGVFGADNCGFVIDPYKDMTHYFQTFIDVSGAVADMKNTITGWDDTWNGEYEIKIGLNYNVGWMLEMKVPFKNYGRTPKPGDTWGVSFGRLDITKEFSVWNHGVWCDPSYFEELAFSGEAR